MLFKTLKTTSGCKFNVYSVGRRSTQKSSAWRAVECSPDKKRLCSLEYVEHGTFPPPPCLNPSPQPHNLPVLRLACHAAVEPSCAVVITSTCAVATDCVGGTQKSAILYEVCFKLRYYVFVDIGHEKKLESFASARQKK